MSDVGIYLIVEFEWPENITSQMYQGSALLHKVVTEADWIEEIVAAYGGIGSGKSCIWIFRFSDYTKLNQLMNHTFTDENEVNKSYSEFFSKMVGVETKIRHEVMFS